LISEVRPSVVPPKIATADGPAQSIRQVLIVEENFDNLGFTRKLVPRPGVEQRQPASIRPVFKPHQSSGLAWIQEAWMLGFPGTLLADDMGLGKTLQALAFLAWLRELQSGISSEAASGPVLIVAPTGLLANWEKEHGLHLHEPGLGDLCRAYGRHLKILKIGGEFGSPSLDQQRLRQSDWVLTTYETLRDFHLSFAAVPFSCVVFDEMQKVKSPTSLLTRAAKTVNAEFTLGLIGTPIENHLADLWCIMDIIYPGLLGDLKAFSGTYKPEEVDSLEQLRCMLLDRALDKPPPILRRMRWVISKAFRKK
jgi:SNF2 family DNA or RNA helicase